MSWGLSSPRGAPRLMALAHLGKALAFEGCSALPAPHLPAPHLPASTPAQAVQPTAFPQHESQLLKAEIRCWVCTHGQVWMVLRHGKNLPREVLSYPVPSYRSD